MSFVRISSAVLLAIERIVSILIWVRIFRDIRVFRDERVLLGYLPVLTKFLLGVESISANHHT